MTTLYPRRVKSGSLGERFSTHRRRYEFGDSAITSRIVTVTPQMASSPRANIESPVGREGKSNEQAEDKSAASARSWSTNTASAGRRKVASVQERAGFSFNCGEVRLNLKADKKNSEFRQRD